MLCLLEGLSSEIVKRGCRYFFLVDGFGYIERAVLYLLGARICAFSKMVESCCRYFFLVDGFGYIERTVLYLLLGACICAR